MPNTKHEQHNYRLIVQQSTAGTPTNLNSTVIETRIQKNCTVSHENNTAAVLPTPKIWIGQIHAKIRTKSATLTQAIGQRIGQRKFIP